MEECGLTWNWAVWFDVDLGRDAGQKRGKIRRKLKQKITSSEPWGIAERTHLACVVPISDNAPVFLGGVGGETLSAGLCIFTSQHPKNLPFWATFRQPRLSSHLFAILYSL